MDQVPLRIVTFKNRWYVLDVSILETPKKILLLTNPAEFIEIVIWSPHHHAHVWKNIDYGFGDAINPSHLSTTLDIASKLACNLGLPYLTDDQCTEINPNDLVFYADNSKGSTSQAIVEITRPVSKNDVYIVTKVEQPFSGNLTKGVTLSASKNCLYPLSDVLRYILNI